MMYVIHEECKFHLHLARTTIGQAKEESLAGCVILIHVFSVDDICDGDLALLGWHLLFDVPFRPIPVKHTISRF
jgi:hypothetical protein